MRASVSAANVPTATTEPLTRSMVLIVLSASAGRPDDSAQTAASITKVSTQSGALATGQREGPTDRIASDHLDVTNAGGAASAGSYGWRSLPNRTRTRCT